jgi:hypothetical protein
MDADEGDNDEGDNVPARKKKKEHTTRLKPSSVMNLPKFGGEVCCII